MTRLVVVEDKSKKKADASSAVGSVYAPDASDGENAKRLLEMNGFIPRRQEHKNGQFEFNCPFHEEAGTMGQKKPTNFYINAKTSQYYCQAASCSEQGNLQTLERYFGIAADPALALKFRSKDTILQEFEAALNPTRMRLLEEKGLLAETIQRFRIGFDVDKDAYVIPYLEARRPVAFRYYDPIVRETDPETGKVSYGGPNGSKYWWEASDKSIGFEDESVLRLFNPGAANGDGGNGQVFICEGEFKAMLLAQWGFAAVSIPGVTGYKPEWARYFMHAKQVHILMDNDNPEAHKKKSCRRCSTDEQNDCEGHNPGQDGAAKLVDIFGYRAHNIVLPLPDGERKVDINEYVMRDGHAKHEFMRLVTGSESDSIYAAKTLGEIRKSPPPEAVFLASGGLLPKAGRLLVTGAPKVGKSIFIENLVLSIAAGIPFLHKFEMANTGLTPGHRVLLLDRELSERSLYDRLNALIDERPGYQAAEDKLLIDHRFKLGLDQPGAADDLIGLIRENNAEVVVLDTAYKFFVNGDIESSKSLSKAFANIDAAILETGASFILTHHHRKGSNAKGEAPSADSVVGSFLWTGWANGTVLLNFKNRSVADPYTVIASFVAFRDAAAPDPLLLRRDKTSIAYKDVEPFSFEEEPGEGENATSSYGSGSSRPQGGKRPRLTYDSLADVLIQQVPVIEDEFLHQAAAHFGVKIETVRPLLIDILDRHDDFSREGTGKRGDPFRWKYAHDKVEETYEEEGTELDEFGQIPGQMTVEEMFA